MKTIIRFIVLTFVVTNAARTQDFTLSFSKGNINQLMAQAWVAALPSVSSSIQSAAMEYNGFCSVEYVSVQLRDMPTVTLSSPSQNAVAMSLNFKALYVRVGTCIGVAEFDVYVGGTFVATCDSYNRRLSTSAQSLYIGIDALDQQGDIILWLVNKLKLMPNYQSYFTQATAVFNTSLQLPMLEPGLMVFNQLSTDGTFINCGFNVPIPLAVNYTGPTSIETAEKGAAPNMYTWTATPTGGVPPYTYTWYEVYGSTAYQLATTSSYTLYLSYEGVGDPQQYGLRLDVRDANTPPSTASITKTITKTFSSGGYEIKTLGDRFGTVAKSVPKELTVGQNYPNPFNPETDVRFGLPEPSQVAIRVYDLLGKEISDLGERMFGPGYYQQRWSGKDDAGNSVGSGLYFMRFTIRAESGITHVRTVKMALMK